ncbi:MAG: very short patch repair endonuclease [Lachnospiraceae bacterium]|nr:very short patch repair endonuclease [Lachnospiraceae bacterium]
MDDLTPAQRRKNMQHIRSKDTSIEMKLRTALWHSGIRYRKNYTALPGKPDIAITKYKIAVFCDSTFWHGRDFDNKKKPATNSEYWEKKICRNMKRDEEVNKILRSMGWTVLRFWDKEIEKSIDVCVRSIQEVIFDVKLTGKEIDYGETEKG